MQQQTLRRPVLVARLPDYGQHPWPDIDRLAFIVAQDQDPMFAHGPPFLRCDRRAAKGFQSALKLFVNDEGIDLSGGQIRVSERFLS